MLGDRILASIFAAALSFQSVSSYFGELFDGYEQDVAAETEISSTADEEISSDSVIDGLTDSEESTDGEDFFSESLPEDVDLPDASVQSHFVPSRVSVLDYGADGFDRLDDFAAIQSALDAVYQGDRLQRTVFVPDGEYYISDCLTIHSGTTLKLSSGARIVRLDESKIMLTTADDTGIKAGGYSHASNIKISGGEWDGAVKNANFPITLFSINHASGVEISDTHIRNFCGSHGVIYNATEKITVRRVTFSDFHECRTPGLNSRNWQQEALHLDYASSRQPIVGMAFPLDDTPCRAVTVENCVFINVPAGVGTHHDYDGLYADNVRITGCYFENIDFSAVNAYGFRTAEISDNIAQNCLSFANMRKCDGKIFGNTANLRNEADPILGDGITDGHQLRVRNSTLQITDNVFKGGAGSGLSVGDGSYVILVGNMISYVSSTGVKSTDRSTIKMNGNTIKKCGSNGIYISGGAELSLSGDKISGCKKYGIFAAGSGKLTASSATISSCKGKGAYCAASSVSLSSCTFKNNTDDAVYVNSGKVTVNKCIITENKHRGIVVKDARVISEYSKIYKNSSSSELYFTSGSSGSFKNTTVGGGGIKGASVSDIRLVNTKFRIGEGDISTEKKAYKYTGKSVCPKVVVRFAGKKLKEGRDYELTYSKNKKRGTASVTAEGIGDYKGTITAKFIIK